jgi:hypothetical protein
VHSLLVRAAHVDSPAAYRLYDLDHDRDVPLSVIRSSATTLTLTPRRGLATGRYAFVATHEGMFGGRDYDYLTVVPPGAPVTAIASNPSATTPAVADALLPLAATLVALLFAARLALSSFRRPAAQKLFWAVGFALFSIAAATETVAYRSGWSPALFRLYYLTGGVLTVAFLGAGSAWLLLPPRARDAMAGGLAVAAAAALAAVLLAPVHVDALGGVHSGRPPSNHALGGHAFLWAIVLNTFGTVFLVGGSAWSIVRRRRVRPNAWIGLGALVTALATGMSRADVYTFVYLGQLLGIGMMFCGFMLSGPKRARRAQPTPRAVLAAPD